MTSRQGQSVNGWLNLEKPSGISSAKSVAIVKKIFNAAKAGHAGTLDPLASGVLPIALGEATKTVSYTIIDEKKYEFSLAWGSETSTDDLEGSVTRSSEFYPTLKEVNKAIPKFLGVIYQSPPNYSAIKIGGKRAYKLARSAEKGCVMPEIKSRKIHVKTFECLFSDNVGARFSVCCGKGTYIRALARDLGRAVGSAAHVTKLERLSVGSFQIKNAISLDFLKKLTHSADARGFLLPVMSSLDDILALRISGEDAKKLRHGQSLRVPDGVPKHSFAELTKDETAIAIEGQTPVALVRLKGGVLCPIRVLNL